MCQPVPNADPTHDIEWTHSGPSLDRNSVLAKCRDRATRADGRETPQRRDGDATVDPIAPACIREHLQVERRGHAYRLWVREEDPPLDRPIDLVYGVRNLNFIERAASEKLRWACTNYTVCRPTRRLVIDVALPATVFDGQPPLLRASIDPFSELDPIGGPPTDQRDSLPTTARFRRVGNRERGAESDDLPSAALRKAFDLLDWDIDAFNRYRLELDYPTMFVGLQMWYPLEGS